MFSRLNPAIGMTSLSVVLAACSSALVEPHPRPSSTTLPVPLATSAGCTSPSVEYDHVSFFLEGEDPKWTLGYSVEQPPAYALKEYVREGNNIQNWRELFSVLVFNAKAWGRPSPEESLDALRSQREKRCPGMTLWSVIEKAADSVLYESRSNLVRVCPPSTTSPKSSTASIPAPLLGIPAGNTRCLRRRA